MTKEIENHHSPIEKLLEARKSDSITNMSVEDLRDIVVVAEYHISLLEQIIQNLREPQSRGGRTRGVNKDTGEDVFEKRRGFAVTWMLREFAKNSNRQFNALLIEFQQHDALPFNQNNLQEVWRRWNSELNEDEKNRLLANYNQIAQNKLQ